MKETIHNISFDIHTLSQWYEKGAITPVDVIKESYRRIKQVNDPGIFITLFPEQDVLRQARALIDSPDKLTEKPLWGIPFAIKDNIDAQGYQTTAGCPGFSYPAQSDAHVVGKLKAAGALLLGKTNLDQFATGLVGVRTPYPVPKNAVDPMIIPGGSSSGSAVAVAHNFVSFALGTDTAGSGRVPAALNNIVGLKPSLGLLSATGVVPACRTLDTISVFSLTVEDAYLVCGVSSGFDKNDCYSKKSHFKPLTALTSTLTHPMAIGVPGRSFLRFYGDDIQESSYLETIQEIKKMGNQVVELDFSVFYEIASLLYEGPWVAERYAALESILSKNPESLLEVTRKIIMAAEKYSAADAFKSFYKLKNLERQALEALNTVDLLCVPSIPRFYCLKDLQQDPLTPNTRLGTYTNFVNLLGLCGLTVPVCPRKDGRPGSVTLLGKAKEDGLLASFGVQLQQKFNDKATKENKFSGLDCSRNNYSTNNKTLELAVVGAHLSGLPLNHELTELGGKLLRSAKTASIYKLYKLPGGPPFKPGMIQAEDGSAIDVEVWALPVDQVGCFMMGVKAPLCIGTITLGDGCRVKGFLCEQSGVSGAVEITNFGGWRNYLSSGQEQ